MKQSSSHPLKKGLALLAIPFLSLFLWAFAEPEYVRPPLTAIEVEPLSLIDVLAEEVDLKPVNIPQQRPQHKVESKVDTGKVYDSSSIIFRGLSEQPLFVVDDEIVPDFESIPQETIYSVSILKEKKMIERYGEKAKNGVVIITTQEGHKKLSLDTEAPPEN